MGKNAPTCFLLLCQENSRLAAVAPLYLLKKHGLRLLHVMGDTEQADVSWMIAESVNIEDALDTMLAHLRLSIRGWDGIRFYHVTSCAMMEGLRRVGLKYGWHILIRQMGESRYIDLRAGADAVLGLVSSRMRNTIRKGQRKAKRTGKLSFKVSSKISPDEFESVLYIEQNSWKSSEDFRLNSKRAFYEDVFHALSRSGELRFSMLYMDDIPIAYLISLQDLAGKVMAYETAYHREYGDISAGSLLHYEEVRTLAGGAGREFDFMGGSENYKAEWTADKRPVYELVLLRQNAIPFVYGIPYVKIKWLVMRGLPLIRSQYNLMKANIKRV